MSIVITPLERVHLSQFLDQNSLVLDVKEVKPGRWLARVNGAEVMSRGMLHSTYGEGYIAPVAIKDYVEKIVGQRIVVGAYTPKRRELEVPQTLHFGDPDATTTEA